MTWLFHLCYPISPATIFQKRKLRLSDLPSVTSRPRRKTKNKEHDMDCMLSMPQALCLALNPVYSLTLRQELSLLSPFYKYGHLSLEESRSPACGHQGKRECTWDLNPGLLGSRSLPSHKTNGGTFATYPAQS